MIFLIKDIPHAQAWLATYNVCKTRHDFQLLYVMGSSTEQCNALMGVIKIDMSYRMCNNFAQDIEPYSEAKVEGRRVECLRYLTVNYERLLLATHTATVPATNKLEDLSL